MSNEANDAFSRECLALVERYLEVFPDERGRTADLRSLLGSGADVRDRRTMPGHLTASGVVYDPARRRVLLIHHRGLGRWLQPGGHVEAGERPADAAAREVLEEVGLAGVPPRGPVAGTAVPLDLDSHPIPANPSRGEPAHAHHDFRYAFVVDSALPLALQEDEVHASDWVGPDDVRVPDNLRLAIDKLKRIAS